MSLLHYSNRFFVKLGLGAFLGLFLALTPAMAAESNGKPYALHMVSVGITNARGQARLQSTKKDALDMQQWARWQEGRLFQQVNTNLLTNEEATRHNILSALKRLKGRVKPGDYTILYMSAHGGKNKFGEYAFCAYDTNLVWSEITNALRSLPGTKMVILDTCQAGAIFQGDNLIVFSACLADQGSKDGAGPNGNSLYTQFLLEALHGKADMNQNGLVSLAEMTAYVSGKLEMISQGQNPERQQSCTLWRPQNIPDALPLAKVTRVAQVNNQEPQPPTTIVPVNPVINPTPQPPTTIVPVNPVVITTLAGTTWNGSESIGGGYGDLSFQFLEGGRAVMIDAREIVQGTYTINGNRVTITLPGVATYRGTIIGRTLSGTGRDNTRVWDFRVSR